MNAFMHKYVPLTQQQAHKPLKMTHKQCDWETSSHQLSYFQIAANHAERVYEPVCSERWFTDCSVWEAELGLFRLISAAMYFHYSTPRGLNPVPRIAHAPYVLLPTDPAIKCRPWTPYTCTLTLGTLRPTSLNSKQYLEITSSLFPATPFLL